VAEGRRDLSGVDLNLLVVLDAILEHGGVGAAAVALGKSQSAVSHALGRLREQLGDPLLVRVGQGVEPTARAAELREPLERVLGELGVLLTRAPAFEPGEARREFTLMTSDYTQCVFLPDLMEDIRARAPGVDVRLVPPVSESATMMARGELDLGFAVMRPEGANLRYRRVLQDAFVCAVSNRAEGPLDLSAYLARPHALITPQGLPGSFVDTVLEARGLRRRVVLRTPYFLGLARVLAQTDLVTTVPARLARFLFDHPGVQVVPAPLELAELELGLVWHERSHRDPAHQWFRERVVEVCGRRREEGR